MRKTDQHDHGRGDGQSQPQVESQSEPAEVFGPWRMAGNDDAAPLPPNAGGSVETPRLQAVAGLKLESAHVQQEVLPWPNDNSRFSTADGAGASSNGSGARMPVRRADLLASNMPFAFPHLTLSGQMVEGHAHRHVRRFHRPEPSWPRRHRRRGGLWGLFAGMFSGAHREGRYASDWAIDRPVVMQQSSPALEGQVDRLSKLVQELERTVSKLASGGYSFAAPAAPRLRFTREAAPQRTEEQDAMLKEIFESNLALRHGVRQLDDGSASASADAGASIKESAA